MRGLTPRQRQMLDFIIDATKAKGYPPTVREIGQAMGIRSTNGVNDHLRALEHKGAVQRDEMVGRGLRVLVDRDWSPAEATHVNPTVKTFDAGPRVVCTVKRELLRQVPFRVRSSDEVFGYGDIQLEQTAS